MPVLREMFLRYLLKSAEIPLQAVAIRQWDSVAKTLGVHGIAGERTDAGDRTVQKYIGQRAFPGLGWADNGNLQGMGWRVAQ